MDYLDKQALNEILARIDLAITNHEQRLVFSGCFGSKCVGTPSVKGPGTLPSTTTQQTGPFGNLLRIPNEWQRPSSHDMRDDNKENDQNAANRLQRSNRKTQNQRRDAILDYNAGGRVDVEAHKRELNGLYSREVKDVSCNDPNISNTHFRRGNRFARCWGKGEDPDDSMPPIKTATDPGSGMKTSTASTASVSKKTQEHSKQNKDKKNLFWIWSSKKSDQQPVGNKETHVLRRSLQPSSQVYEETRRRDFHAYPDVKHSYDDLDDRLFKHHKRQGILDRLKGCVGNCLGGSPVKNENSKEVAKSLYLDVPRNPHQNAEDVGQVRYLIGLQRPPRPPKNQISRPNDKERRRDSSSNQPRQNQGQTENHSRRAEAQGRYDLHELHKRDVEVPEIYHDKRGNFLSNCFGGDCLKFSGKNLFARPSSPAKVLNLPPAKSQKSPAKVLSVGPSPDPSHEIATEKASSSAARDNLPLHPPSPFQDIQSQSQGQSRTQHHARDACAEPSADHMGKEHGVHTRNIHGSASAVSAHDDCQRGTGTNLNKRGNFLSKCFGRPGRQPSTTFHGKFTADPRRDSDLTAGTTTGSTTPEEVSLPIKRKKMTVPPSVIEMSQSGKEKETQHQQRDALPHLDVDEDGILHTRAPDELYASERDLAPFSENTYLDRRGLMLTKCLGGQCQTPSEPPTKAPNYAETARGERHPPPAKSPDKTHSTLSLLSLEHNPANQPGTKGFSSHQQNPGAKNSGDAS